MWNDSFRISNGEKTSIDEVEDVYRSYRDDCGIVVTQEVFNEEIAKYPIYHKSMDLSDVLFCISPGFEGDAKKQIGSSYHFLTFDLKLPRK